MCSFVKEFTLVYGPSETLRHDGITTDYSGIPACFLAKIIAFPENLGRWGLESEVSASRAGTGNNYFDSPLSLPGLRVTLGGPCPSVPGTAGPHPAAPALGRK